MLVLVLVLVATNVLSLAALAYYLLRPAQHPEPDARVAAYLAEQRPAVSTSGVRRVITIEILNPLELAGKRGRLAGLAGSLAPGITRRVVYDQAIRLVRRQLSAEHVVADVRLCLVRPEDAAPTGVPAAPPTGLPAPAPAAPSTVDDALDEPEERSG